MRIVVAMSGGVDSSVAAALLAEQGHDVIGLSMQLYPSPPFGGAQGDLELAERSTGSGQANATETFGSCCTLDDLHDARRVASARGFPHYIVNFERQFRDTVIANFVTEYTSGRTPIPCAHCNSDMKFATLLDRARGLGSEHLATGHYARVEQAADGRFLLRRSVDTDKDQSYFLFSLTQDQLARAVFPVGDRPKDEVREYARRRRLPVADKPDSQEICFVPDDDYAGFVSRHAPDAAGDGVIVDEAGRVLGSHSGIHRFTVGQRKGLGLGSAAGVAGAPLYVLQLRPADRQVVVGPKTALERTTLTASGVNWIAEEPTSPIRACAQIRHRHHAAPATIRSLGGVRAEAVFDTPQIAITPGQAVVFYDGDAVLGGGWID